MVELCEEELCQQLASIKVYISGRSDTISNKLFPSTLRGVTMQWLSGLPAQTIQSFGDLATLFIFQFATNKSKQMEVVYLFDIKQMKGENLKVYLARFNSTTIRVNDPNQKFFVKAFHKGLHVNQFNDLLTLRRLFNMKEIRAQAKKHIEAEENLTDRLEVEC
ncbi:hypothetical protein CR513_22053, partial [Mucuna pruriens]